MKRAHRTVSTFISLADIFGLSLDDERGIHAAEAMLSRWRQALLADDAFVRALEDARYRAVRICEQQPIGTVRGTEGTGGKPLRMRARWKLGQLLAEVERAQVPGTGRGHKGEKRVLTPSTSFRGLLSDLSLDPAIALRAQRIGTLPEDELDKALAEAARGRLQAARRMLASAISHDHSG